MHALRHRPRRQPISPSHEQAIQALYVSSQAPSAIPERKYVPGTYAPDRLFPTRRLLRCELGKQPWQWKVNFRLFLHDGWRTTQLQDLASKRDNEISHGVGGHLNGTCERGGGNKRGMNDVTNYIVQDRPGRRPHHDDNTRASTGMGQ